MVEVQVAGSPCATGAVSGDPLLDRTVATLQDLTRRYRLSARDSVLATREGATDAARQLDRAALIDEGLRAIAGLHWYSVSTAAERAGAEWWLFPAMLERATATARSR